MVGKPFVPLAIPVRRREGLLLLRLQLKDVYTFFLGEGKGQTQGERLRCNQGWKESRIPGGREKEKRVRFGCGRKRRRVESR